MKLIIKSQKSMKGYLSSSFILFSISVLFWVFVLPFFSDSIIFNVTIAEQYFVWNGKCLVWHSFEQYLVTSQAEHFRTTTSPWLTEPHTQHESRSAEVSRSPSHEAVTRFFEIDYNFFFCVLLNHMRNNVHKIENFYSLWVDICLN